MQPSNIFCLWFSYFPCYSFTGCHLFTNLQAQGTISVSDFIETQFDVHRVLYTLMCPLADSNQGPSLAMFAGLLSLYSLVTFIHSFFPLFKPPPAIIICLDHSFWHQSWSCSVVEAFKIAFHLYKSTGMQKQLETALDLMDDEIDFQERLTDNLLKHRLGLLFFSTLILLCQLYSMILW